MIELNKTDREKVIQEVNYKFDLGTEFETPFKSKRDKYYKLYKSHINKSAYPFKSKIFIPITLSLIETVLPRIMGAIFESKPWFVVNPIGEEDVNAASGMTRVQQYQLEKMRWFVNCIDLMKTMLMYGSTVGKVYQKVVVASEPNYVPQTTILGQNLGSMNNKKFKLRLEPVIETVDRDNIVHDPNGWDIQSSEWVIEENWVSDKWVADQERAKVFYKGTYNALLGDSSTLKQHRLERLGLVGLNDGDKSASQYSRTIHIKDYWEDNQVKTVLNGNVLARVDSNIYDHEKKPYFNIKCIPVPFEFDGIGIIEIAYYLQHVVNDLGNMRMDHLNININKMYAVQEGTVDDYRDFRSRPGGIIRVRDLNGFKELENRPLPMDAWKEASYYESQIQNATGIFDYAKGASPARAETASGIAFLQEAANFRFRLIMQTAEMSGLYDMLQLLTQNNMQFLKGNIPVREATDMGYIFHKYSADEIRGNFDFSVNGNITESKSIRKQQIMTTVAALRDQPYINQPALNSMILDMQGIKNKKEILRDPLKDLEAVAIKLIDQGVEPGEVLKTLFSQPLQKSISTSVTGGRPSTAPPSSPSTMSGFAKQVAVMGKGMGGQI